MEWSIHPAKGNITKTILSLIFIFGFLLYIGYFFGMFWSIFGFLVLFISLHTYYFPTHYKINDDTIYIKKMGMTQRRSLSQFKKMYIGKKGVLLSPFQRKTFLNRFRGVFLFLPENQDAIISFLRDRVEKPSEETEEQGN